MVFEQWWMLQAQGLAPDQIAGLDGGCIAVDFSGMHA